MTTTNVLEQAVRSRGLAFTQKLQIWAGKPGRLRDFRWRRTSDIYELFIAELLLRRTNAPAASGIYDEVLNRYPDLERFKHAEPEELYTVVARLGLNWRAKNVVDLSHQLRIQAVESLPLSISELTALPGVGPYVARATLLNAGKISAIPVDSNVVRVVCRFFGIPASDSLRRNKKFQEIADSLAPRNDLRAFNYALLDLASSICSSQSPRCQYCPLASDCSYCLVEGQKA